MITLDDRLSRDCCFVEKLDICQLLLMKDATYPWLVLVPDREGLRDLHDLDVGDHLAVMREITLASELLQTLFDAYKINVAALGNMVPQLHIHVIARQTADPAWPGPVWGAVPPSPYSEDALNTRLVALREAIVDRLSC